MGRNKLDPQDSWRESSLHFQEKILDLHFKCKALGWENEQTLVSPWCSATTAYLCQTSGGTRVWPLVSDTETSVSSSKTENQKLLQLPGNFLWCNLNIICFWSYPTLCCLLLLYTVITAKQWIWQISLPLQGGFQHRSYQLLAFASFCKSETRRKRMRRTVSNRTIIRTINIHNSNQALVLTSLNSSEWGFWWTAWFCARKS